MQNIDIFNKCPKGALDNLNTPDAVAAAADRKKKLDAIKNAEGPEAAEKAAKELPPLPPTFSQTKAAALAPALFDAVAVDHDAAIARFADSRFAPETFVRRSDPKTLNTREIRVEYNEHVAEYCRTSVDSLRGRLAAQDFSEAIGPDARKDWLAVDSVVAKIQGDVTAATKLAVELDLVYKAADVGKKACAKVRLFCKIQKFFLTMPRSRACCRTRASSRSRRCSCAGC